MRKRHMRMVKPFVASKTQAAPSADQLAGSAMPVEPDELTPGMIIVDPIGKPIGRIDAVSLGDDGSARLKVWNLTQKAMAEVSIPHGRRVSVLTDETAGLW